MRLMQKQENEGHVLNAEISISTWYIKTLDEGKRCFNADLSVCINDRRECRISETLMLRYRLVFGI